jgi:hypothetical protein
MTIKGAHNLCPELDISGTIRSLARKAGSPILKIDRVIVVSPDYLARLSNIL